MTHAHSHQITYKQANDYQEATRDWVMQRTRSLCNFLRFTFAGRSARSRIHQTSQTSRMPFSMSHTQSSHIVSQSPHVGSYTHKQSIECAQLLHMHGLSHIHTHSLPPRSSLLSFLVSPPSSRPPNSASTDQARGYSIAMAVAAYFPQPLVVVLLFTLISCAATATDDDHTP